MPTFTLQLENGTQSEVEVTEGEFIIGRDASCDIVINSTDISREHTKITMKKNDVYVEDLNSRNGTYLNTTPINEVKLLKHMDIFQIGENTFLFNDRELNDEKPSSSSNAEQTHSQLFNFDFLQKVIYKMESNIGNVIKGKPEVIKKLLICLLADGHLLIEDVPGVGKSILAQTLAKTILATYKRIQFSPDMLPSDITGMNIYDEKKKEFFFIPGPIFGNIILADEINRTTPRTQSSLLECMSESKITIDGKPHVLPKPFFVIATQNPSDYHGTYPLPKPQLDRFMMCISIGYPDPQTEIDILTSQEDKHPINDISHVVKSMDIMLCQALVRKTYISDSIKDYIIKIITATRKHVALSIGSSPRGAIALMRIAQALASYEDRDYVIPEDVRTMAACVLAHRMTLKPRALAEWESTENVIESILEKIPIPMREPHALSRKL